ncbi:ggdef domain/hd domain protein [Treponema primitia ZAS-2]|uniref:diguanylate cyclase n=1 Tax=Treponema primitia (strain ATCC BAA-887 / DSM 12427 / ZAS-2) TaxID=545694 RepID=F5YLR7_TREPZ|nr:sensor domain-containing diguanylate cyclase [Treponema primitia]AEF86400.1 ggdef domain/hd domain protein [Treponema primitia ZAS-2]
MNETPDLHHFLSDPKIVEHYSLLEEVGVFAHIDSLNKEIRDYKDLLDGAMDIFNRTNIEEIMDATVRQISDQFLPGFIVFLWKPHQNKEEITIKGYQNYKNVEISLKIESITPFEAFFQTHPKPVNFDLLESQTEAATTFSTLKQLKPELVAPIMGPSNLYGLIIIGHRMLEKEYTPRELTFLEELMSFVSQAIQNHLHYEQSVRDVKTGLFNHGFFMTRLMEEIARTRRRDDISSLIVIDVDKFKNFNDSYGHLAGDRVLECLAQTIKGSVRTEDVPSRFGGEEFTILLPSSNRDAAWLVAERLRNSVAEMEVPWEPPLPQVTISLGIVTFDKQAGLTADDIIKRADAALYQSKEQGRNRSTVWEPSTPEHTEN